MGTLQVEVPQCDVPSLGKEALLCKRLTKPSSKYVHAFIFEHTSVQERLRWHCQLQDWRERGFLARDVEVQCAPVLFFTFNQIYYFPPARQTTLTNMLPTLPLVSVKSGTTSSMTCWSSSFIPHTLRMVEADGVSHKVSLSLICRYYQKPTWFARKYVYHDTQVSAQISFNQISPFDHYHRHHRASGSPRQK